MAKLSPAEREWYDRFVDQFYGGDFRADTDEEWSVDQRRQTWRDQKAACQDAYGLAGLGGGPDEIPLHAPATPTADWSATPEYLNDPEYRQARDEFRAQLSKRRSGAEPKVTFEYLKAKRVLDIVTPTVPLPGPKPRRTPTPKRVVRPRSPRKPK